MIDLKNQLEMYLHETTVPIDVDGLVARREQASEIPGAPVRGSHRWRPAVVLAAAMLALVVIGGPLLVLGVFSSTPVVEEPTTTMQVTTTTVRITTTTTPVTTTIVPEAEQVVAYSISAAEADVAEFHDLYNSGDVAAFTRTFSDQRHFDYDNLAIAMQILGTQLEAQCEPGVATTSGAVEVRCAVTLVEDQFYTPAGIRWTRDVIYVVDDSGIHTDTGDGGTVFFWSQGLSLEALEYLRAFDDWLFGRHQAGLTLRGWIWVDPNNGLLPNWLDGKPCCLYSVETRSAAESMVGLVDEFLAIPDDQWPVVEPPIAIEVTGSVAQGSRGEDVLFTLTHDPEMFADLEMVREPDGILASYRPGWHSYVWHVFEFVEGTENSPGDYLQVEIHRLWSADGTTDVLWLTDYSGATRDTLTGYPPSGPPPQSPTFTLLDAIVLEGRLDLFGLHNDCQIVDDEVGAALFSFEGDDPVALIGWTIDGPTREFVEIDDPATVNIGDCLTPEPRG